MNIENSQNTPSARTAGPRPGPVLVALAAAFLICLLVAIVLGVKKHGVSAQLADTQKQLGDEKAQAAQSQSDLDKAKSAQAELQAQLKTATAKQSDLQAQLDQARSSTNDLNNQIEREKQRAAEVQAQLDKTNTRAADLEGQVHSGRASSAQMMTQLDQDRIQSMDLQTRLQKAEADIAALQPMLLKARHMPVSTAFEKSGWGRGYELKISNLYQQPITVSVNITGSDKRAESHVIGSGATVSVGNLKAGDKVAITSDGYDAVNLTVQGS
jgi:hypothetical protein